MPRKSLVRAPIAMVERKCSNCGRVALDVRVDPDGKARCFSHTGCSGKLYRATGSTRAGSSNGGNTGRSAA